MPQADAFWDRIAPRYAKRPVGDPGAYETTLERTRAYLSGEDQVLEVGCGTGSTALTLAPKVRHITATDYAAGMIRIAKDKLDDAAPANVAFRHEALAADDPAEEPFDAVLGFNLLHLVDDVPAALETLSRRLKPGGHLITKTACIGRRQWLLRGLIAVMRAIGKAPPVTYLEPGELEEMVRAAGFRILETGDYPKKPPSHFIVARKL